MSRGKSTVAEPKSASEKSALEKQLEAAIFGNGSFQDNIEHDEADVTEYVDAKDAEEEEGSNDYSALEDEQLFMVDDGAMSIGLQAEFEPNINGTPTKTDDDDEEEDNRKSAWHDSDDEKLSISLASAPRLRKLRKTDAEDVVPGLEYARRLRAQYKRIYPVPDWALPPIPQAKKRKRSRADSSGDGSASDEDSSPETSDITISADPLKALLQSSQSYQRPDKSAIRVPSKLDIKRLRDANHQAPSSSAIQTIAFHPTFPLLVTGGYDRTLRLFHIDGKLNTPASSLYLKSVPIENVEFHPDGRRVFIGGKRKYFHIWDLESGSVEKISRSYGQEGMQSNMIMFSLSKSGEYVALVGASGWVNLLSANTGQWLDAFKVTKGISDIAWHTNDDLTVANIGAELWKYSVSERRVVHRWTDDGGMNTTKIALGGLDDRWLAVGSKSGIVNIYDLSQARTENSKATKVLKNITTAIHDLKFASDGQILAMTSRAKKDVLKMVHLPSCTVYQNWPTQNTPLGKIGAIAFSPRSEMFAIGNEGGKATLWSI